MRISEALELEKEVKNFIVTGKVKFVGKEKHIQGTSAAGKDYDFFTIDVLVEDDSGSVYCQLSTNHDEFDYEAKGKTISCINCSINEYVNKDGVTKRSIRARDFSFDVIPEDPAHPVLPNIRVIEKDYREPAEIERDKKIEKKEPEKAGVWDAKDLRIVRQNSNLHATALVCKYFKGDLEEALAKTILVSNELVDSVYTGLSYPIKSETENKQADLLKDMKKESKENVVNAERTALQKKALDLKKEMFTLTRSDFEYSIALENLFGVENVVDLDSEQMAEFCTHIANMVLELQSEAE